MFGPLSCTIRPPGWIITSAELIECARKTIQDIDQLHGTSQAYARSCCWFFILINDILVSKFWCAPRWLELVRNCVVSTSCVRIFWCGSHCDTIAYVCAQDFAVRESVAGILLIARGESKLISAENNAHSQTVNAWITSINNSNAKLLENRRTQVRCCLRTTRDSSRCEMWA